MACLFVCFPSKLLWLTLGIMSTETSGNLFSHELLSSKVSPIWQLFSQFLKPELKASYLSVLYFISELEPEGQQMTVSSGTGSTDGVKKSQRTLTAAGHAGNWTHSGCAPAVQYP